MLIGIAVVATIWLGATGDLTLYIHPRYVVFTVIMSVVALVLVGLGAALSSRHAERGEPLRPVGILAIVLAVAVAAAMIIVPPATLTTATADQRELNSSSVGSEAQSVEGVGGQSDEAFARFTVVDWSSLLRQTSDPAFFAGKSVDVLGFITASDDDSDNIYFVSRFFVTCCAVDAQPVGVAVYSPSWKDSLAVGDWVQVTGGFGLNPSPTGSPAIVLLPESTTKMEEPDEPYLF